MSPLAGSVITGHLSDHRRSAFLSREEPEAKSDIFIFANPDPGMLLKSSIETPLKKYLRHPELLQENIFIYPFRPQHFIEVRNSDNKLSLKYFPPVACRKSDEDIFGNA